MLTLAPGATDTLLVPPLIFTLEANTLARAEGAVVVKATASPSPPIIEQLRTNLRGFMVSLIRLNAVEPCYE